MTTFDTVVVVILGISIIFSLFRGLMKGFFSLLSIFVGYVVAIKYNGLTSEYLKDFVSSEGLAKVIGFIIVFIIAASVISLIGKLLRNIVYSSGVLSVADRLIGGGIGLLIGMVFIVIFMVPLQAFPDTYKEVTRDSVTAPYLEQFSVKLKEILGIEGGMLGGSPGKPGVLEKIKNNTSGLKIESIKEKVGEIIEKANDSTSKDASALSPQDNHSPQDEEKLKDLLDSTKE